MEVTTDISRIYEELTARYDRISVSTIKSVLKGKLKVKTGKIGFAADKTSSPRLEEAEDAFKKYNCAIFTAFRGGYTLEQNLKRNACLKADMEALGMSFRPVNGCYREADWEYPCVEYCYFVYNEDKTQSQQFFENAYRLSAKYDQDSFLYKRAGINRTAFLVATTDAGRKDLFGDIKFAGQLYLDVPDVEAWTDCSDGRFAFQLRGMLLINIGHKKIQLGEGDVFDIDAYAADGLVVLHHKSQSYLTNRINAADRIVSHMFKKDSYSIEYIQKIVFHSLNTLIKQCKCQRIGLLCTVAIDGDRVKGALATLDAVKLWVERHSKKIKSIVIADCYGDYSKAINQTH